MGLTRSKLWMTLTRGSPREVLVAESLSGTGGEKLRGVEGETTSLENAFKEFY